MAQQVLVYRLTGSAASLGMDFLFSFHNAEDYIIHTQQFTP